MSIKTGDRVRISSPVVLFHHPKHRNQPHNAEGMEGTVKEVLNDWQGRPISPNFPVVVEFSVDGVKRPFKAHLANTELEVL